MVQHYVIAWVHPKVMPQSHFASNPTTQIITNVHLGVRLLHTLTAHLSYCIFNHLALLDSQSRASHKTFHWSTGNTNLHTLNTDYYYMHKQGLQPCMLSLSYIHCSSYQPSPTRHSSFHMEAWLATLQPTCNHGSPINHRQRSNTADGIGTRPRTKKNSIVLLMFTKLWLSLTSHILSVLQHRSLLVLVFNMQPALPRNWKRSSL